MNKQLDLFVFMFVASLLMLAGGCSGRHSLQKDDTSLVFTPRLGVNFGTVVAVSGKLRIKLAGGKGRDELILVADKVNDKKLQKTVEVYLGLSVRNFSSASIYETALRDLEDWAKRNQYVRLVGYETIGAWGNIHDPRHYITSRDGIRAFQGPSWTANQGFSVIKIIETAEEVNSSGAIKIIKQNEQQ